jgi:hypothetical protein
MMSLSSHLGWGVYPEGRGCEVQCSTVHPTIRKSPQRRENLFGALALAIQISEWLESFPIHPADTCCTLGMGDKEKE